MAAGPANAGTQIGSEGFTAPTKADDQTTENARAVVVLIGANDYGFASASQPTAGRP
jgi:hypothetical protein